MDQMKKATTEFLKRTAAFCESRKREILNTPDTIKITGTTYYVSAEGDDSNDGRTPETAWKTLEKVSSASFEVNDGVRFRRGDVFRGCVTPSAGVTYAAYGSGPKPEIRGWKKNLADKSLWTLIDPEHHIWQLNEKILDAGTLVFNEGEKHCRKLIPSYIDGKFVCREDESKAFILADEMTLDLDLFCKHDDVLTTVPSHGQDFPVPDIDNQIPGDLFLRCDMGNPGEIFDSIEAIPFGSTFRCQRLSNIKIDNIAIKYTNFAVSAGDDSRGLHVTNCEIGWIGGCVQMYLGLDPNYPEGGRGSVTRYGNGVEIYGGCDDYVVSNCYIYQVYDAGITHQAGAPIRYDMKNIRYSNNLIEYCVYGIEYFLYLMEGGEGSHMENVEICQNIFRYSGYGWGQQRHNFHTPAHIKGWSYENPAVNFAVHDNIFGEAGYRMVHLVAKKAESCPKMYCNTYIQDYGKSLGKYGANESYEPDDIIFDENVASAIEDVFNEYNPKVYCIK